MPPLTTDDVKGWDIPRIEKEMRERLDDVASIREKAGGTLTKVAGDDAAAVRGHNADLSVLGEELDRLKELQGADDRFTKLKTYLETPVDQFPHPGSGGRPEFKARDIGGMFIESDAWKSYKEDSRREVVASIPLESLFRGYKGIGEVPADGGVKALFTTGDFPSQPDFIAQPVETLYQPNNIGPLMAQGTTSAATIRYVEETVSATGAASVAEAGEKPEAALTFDPVDEPVRKIAVWLPLTDESLEDEAFLRSYINARLRLFVQNEEDRQLLLGDPAASPPEIEGILERSGINTATSYSIAGANPDQAFIDGVFKAAMRVRDAQLEPDTTVMRPAMWETARLAKDENRNYLLGPPADDAPQRLWGLRVVLNANMPAQAAGNFTALVGAFRSAAMLIRRSGIDLAISTEHASFFIENKVALRAEERVALAVFRPQGFAVVTSAA